MKKCMVLMSLLALLAGLGQGPGAAAQSVATSAADPADAAPLSLVIAQVKAALDEYQQNLGGGADALPPLKTAAFEFKTATATTDGITINFFIFKFGGSHEKDAVNDVTYTYTVPKPIASKSITAHNAKPPTLKDTLARTIQSAAMAIKTSGKMGNLSFSKLEVNVEYGVKWDGSVGVNVPIQFITVGLGGEKNKNTVQSVDLVFGQ
ncbi:MAG TPA: hypothetical protein VJO53_01465 [Candidatus Acidoferrales bacterium]|nr:hypothetical protein [Candidatus Acidoferrales bacterium]